MRNNWNETIERVIDSVNGGVVKIDFILHEMRHDYIMKNGYEGCSIAEDDDGKMTVVRGEDKKFVANGDDCPDMTDAKHVWTAYLEDTVDSKSINPNPSNPNKFDIAWCKFELEMYDNIKNTFVFNGSMFVSNEDKAGIELVEYIFDNEALAVKYAGAFMGRR